MKNLTFNKLLILTVLFLMSCKDNSNDNEKENQIQEETNKQEKTDSLSHVKALDEISKKFNTNTSFNLSRDLMSYEYQGLLTQNQRVIIEKYKIVDIEKQTDSLYNVSLKIGYRPLIFFDFTCSKSEISKLYPEFSNTNYDNSKFKQPFLILKVSSFNKMKLMLTSYAEENEGDEPSSYIELENSKAFMFKGELVGLYPILEN